MTLPQSCHRPFLALALLLAGCALGCSKKQTLDIPAYPNSSQVSSTMNQESDAGTLYRLRRMTPDSVQAVVAFYRDELVAKRGWTEKKGIGPTFADGNLKVTWQGIGPGTAEPVDATRSGGQVVVYEDSNRTFIVMWQHVPK